MMKTITQSILLLFCVGHFTTQAQGLTPVTFLGTNTTQGSNLNQFNQPQGILTSPSNGHIYVVDGGNDRVSVWTQTGNNFGNLTTFGSQGTAAGNFDNPKGIAQSTDGRLFITDQNNHRICVWSVSGSTFTPVATFGSQGTGANQFDSPSGIVISSNGEIFVCEEGNSRISVWSINGSNYTPVTSFGNGFGSANDQFAVPKDIALGSGGFIYISEFDNNRISVWTQSGNTFGNYAVFGTNQYLSGGSGPNDFSGPSGVAINAGGKIYISDTDNSRICIWTHTGNSFGFLTSIGGVYGAALNEFGYPASIAFGSNGRLFISDNLARVSIWQGCAPPTILTQPASQTLCGGNLATFSFTGSGSGLSYLWSNGATTAGMQTSVAGNYMVTVSGTCGSVISSMANLAVQPTTQITHFPSSQTICGGNTATFDVTAVGANLTYNWYHESDLVNPFATTKMATVSLAGIYSVQVIGSCGTESSFPNNLNTLVVNTATGIAQQPMHQTKCGGSMASFEVTAIGNNLSYIWNNGATTSSMSTSISGSYMVTVSGTCGTVISDIANLIVGTPTQITQHPTAETVCEGILKTTGVTAVGTNLTYEWNNGETTSSQTTSLPGAYLVTVTGTCGTAVSNIGLTIQANNKIVQQQTDKKICTGEVAMLQFVADGANMGYNWSNGATTSGIAVSTTGTFMVTVTGTCGVAAVSKPFNVTATPCGGFTAVERWYPVGSVGISAGSAHYQSLEISPSGAPYVAYQDGANGNKTTVLSFNGSNWGAVGSVGISTKSSACQSLAISPSGVPYVAYAEVLITTFITGFKTTVLSFNGSNWGAVGGVGTSEGYLTYQSLAISPSGVPYVAYQDDVNGFKTTVLSFNGSNWGAVGSVGINAGSAEYQSLAISPSGVSYVAHQDYINGFKTTVLSFNGSYWGAVGSAGISSGRAESQSLAISPSGVPYVAYQDDANRSKTTVLSFNGSNWGAVGSVGISAGPTQYQSLAISPSGVPYVAYQDDANGGKTTVLSFNGSNWGAVGSAGISSGRAQSQSLAFSPTGVPYVAYSDGAFGRKTTVLRYGLPPIFEKKATFEITIPKTFSGIATITWPTIAGANTYCIRISTSSNFTTGVKTVCGLTGNSYVYDLSNPNGRTEAATETYYYQVLGVDEEGYYSQWSDAQTFVVDNASTNLPKSESKNLATSVSIYPNPATTELNVTAPANSTLVIYNYLGSVVLSKTLQTTETQLDISSLSNGVYVVKVGDKVVKMIKQ